MKRLLLIASSLVSAACGLIFLGGDTPSPAAHELVKGGARLVDVRSPGEYADGHLPGAVNVPVGEIGNRLADVGSKEAPVVVYCRSGHRSRRAAAALREAGYVAVHDMGAMRNW